MDTHTIPPGTKKVGKNKSMLLNEIKTYVIFS